MIYAEHCEKCGCKLNGEVALVGPTSKVWCHPCADADGRNEMDTPLYKMVMKLYPWVSEADARKIAHEAETKRNDHMFDAAHRLKPR